ncbi:hypothetical protein, partial [Thiolapillus sp.]|uniref:hypothetical protein n=1 Tax=Thiolapillus sp. TaxID=2017437 RepID=UPI003AF6C70F
LPQNPVGGGVGKYDKVELRIGTKNNRNYSKRKSMIYRDLTISQNTQSSPLADHAVHWIR